MKLDLSIEYGWYQNIVNALARSFLRDCSTLGQQRGPRDSLPQHLGSQMSNDNATGLFGLQYLLEPTPLTKIHPLWVAAFQLLEYQMLLVGGGFIWYSREIDLKCDHSNVLPFSTSFHIPCKNYLGKAKHKANRQQKITVHFERLNHSTGNGSDH